MKITKYSYDDNFFYKIQGPTEKIQENAVICDILIITYNIF